MLACLHVPTSAPPAPSVQESAAHAHATVEPASEPWEFIFMLDVLDPPDADGYGAGTFIADRGALHLEARYQYEDLDTASFFVGRNFAWSGDVEFELTPLLGVVAGQTDGIAPGVEFDLTWKWFEWYLEGEYVFDLDDSDDNFAYTWTELTLARIGWLNLGLVAQRTRLYEQDLEVDRGLLVRIANERAWFDVQFFNPDRDDPYVGFSLGISF